MTVIASTDLAAHRSRPAPTPRLPDQADIRFGDIPAIARYIVRADRKLRDHGIRLSLCRDFDELAELNRRSSDWFALPPMFDPEQSEINAADGFWLKGVDRRGETVLSHAMRRYVLDDSLKAEVESLRFLYSTAALARATEARGEATAPSAATLRGRLGYMGALWLRSEYRGHDLARIISPLTRALGLGLWYPTACVSFVSTATVAKGRAAHFGWPPHRLEQSIRFSGLPGGHETTLDFTLCYATAAEIETVIADTLAMTQVSPAQAAPLPPPDWLPSAAAE